MHGIERDITYKNRLVLMKAIVHMVAYHNGYGKPPVIEKTVAKYCVRYRQAKRTGVNVANVFKTMSTDLRLTYVAMIQEKYP